MRNDETLEENLESETGVSVQSGAVELPSDKAATESLVSVVRYFVKNGVIDEGDLPIKSGPNRYILNSTPTHQKGGKMARPEEVVEGIYVERNYNPDQIKRKIRDLFQFAQNK